MEIQQSLDDVYARLVRRGLAPAYIQRLVSELDDHITDMIADRKDPMSTDARTDRVIYQRLGSSRSVAAAAVAEYRRRGFFGRHRALTYLVTPLVLTCLAWGCALGGGFGTAALFMPSRPFTDWPPATVWSVWALFYSCIFIPPVAVATFSTWLAARTRQSWRWTLAASLVVALLAAFFQTHMVLPVRPGAGSISLGFGIGVATLASPLVWLQFAAPLAAGLLTMRRWIAANNMETAGT